MNSNEFAVWYNGFNNALLSASNIKGSTIECKNFAIEIADFLVKKYREVDKSSEVDLNSVVESVVNKFSEVGKK
jgi:hypothetical protein